MLQGVKRSLKDQGRILFQMGGKGNAQDIIDVVRMLIEKETWHPYFNEFGGTFSVCYNHLCQVKQDLSQSPTQTFAIRGIQLLYGLVTRNAVGEDKEGVVGTGIAIHGNPVEGSVCLFSHQSLKCLRGDGCIGSHE